MIQQNDQPDVASQPTPETGAADRPIVEFFCLYPDMPEPEPASRDVRGSVPARAGKVCTPMTVASGFGWYIYPPADFALRWDGSQTEWSLLEDNEPAGWCSLSGGYDAALPAGRDVLARVPEQRRKDLDIFDMFGGTLGFINADPRGPERVELITGVIARTPPGWQLLVREPPNWPREDGVQIHEGIIETEWFRSYLPTILRLTIQNRVVRFYRSLPIMVAQPIPTAALVAARGPFVVQRGADRFPDDVWADYVAWRRYRQDPQTTATYLSRQRERARRTAER